MTETRPAHSFKFSLKTVLLLTLIVSLICAWYVERTRYRREAEQLRRKLSLINQRQWAETQQAAAQLGAQMYHCNGQVAVDFGGGACMAFVDPPFDQPVVPPRPAAVGQPSNPSLQRVIIRDMAGNITYSVWAQPQKPKAFEDFPLLVEYLRGLTAAKPLVQVELRSLPLSKPQFDQLRSTFPWTRFVHATWGKWPPMLGPPD